MVWHGGNFLNLYSLACVLPGLRDWRVYAHWIGDLLDGLGQERASFVDSSFGGGIALRAAVEPERVRADSRLHVPSSIATGSLWRIVAEAGLPMLRYRLRPSHERLGVFLSKIDVTVRAQNERGEGRNRG